MAPKRSAPKRSAVAAAAVTAAAAAAALVPAAAAWSCESGTRTVAGQGYLNVYCLPECAYQSEHYYKGLFNVTSLTGGFESFTVRYGDQPCGAPEYDNQNYKYASKTYEDYFPHYHQFAFYGEHVSYYPKIQFVCNQLRGECELEYEVCLGYFPLDGSVAGEEGGGAVPPQRR